MGRVGAADSWVISSQEAPEGVDVIPLDGGGPDGVSNRVGWAASLGLACGGAGTRAPVGGREIDGLSSFSMKNTLSSELSCVPIAGAASAAVPAELETVL